VDIVRHAVVEAQQNTCRRIFLLSLPEAEVIPIYADADRITEVINNYLSNAHKYSPAGLPIHVSLTIEGSRADVAVRDEGPGISPADQARIWERFYRAPDIKTQEPGCSHANLGLGLYLCKEIIDLHQGQVGVTSTPGQGATFWFTLDLAR
jgi:signal transduction histidine kinase